MSFETRLEDPSISLVSAFYDQFPFPCDQLGNGPPPGYNWRWCVDSAYAFLTGASSPAGRSCQKLRILDAGCGSGVSTDYLSHLNPGSEVLGIDISARALELASKRLTLSGGFEKAEVTFQKISLLELREECSFDYINSVGVLHHLSQPKSGLKALSKMLKDGGLIHLFLYADGGRWEVQRTQRVLKALGVAHDQDGLRLGRKLLTSLPEENRLRVSYEKRWSQECSSDINFADIYLHPQETSYNIESLFKFLNCTDLDFVGFSNPHIWRLDRLLSDELLERASSLPQLQQWKLIEDLDPDIRHFEFFLSKGVLRKYDWSDESFLMKSTPRLSRCIWGWPEESLLDYEMNPLQLSLEARKLMKAIEVAPLGTTLGELSFCDESSAITSIARDLIRKQVLLLSPA